MGKYDNLLEYVNYLETHMGIHICIKDYVGFIPIDQELDRTMFRHLAHLNPFCQYMKSDQTVYMRCTSMLRGMCRKLENGRYCGICHAGVREYMLPICWRGRVVGSVNAGAFRVEPNIASRSIHAACRNSSLDERHAQTLYDQYIRHSDIDEDALYASLAVIANLFSIVFSNIEIHNDFEQKRIETIALHNNIVAAAIEYLKVNYTNECFVKDIAEYCYCSVSCLSHIFKSRVGVSIPLFLNRLRVERGKAELANLNLTIAEVSRRSGFSDPNYFSRIFSRFVGLTPSQFRQSIAQGKRAAMETNAF